MFETNRKDPKGVGRKVWEIGQEKVKLSFKEFTCIQSEEAVIQSFHNNDALVFRWRKMKCSDFFEFTRSEQPFYANFDWYNQFNRR